MRMHDNLENPPSFHLMVEIMANSSWCWFVIPSRSFSEKDMLVSTILPFPLDVWLVSLAYLSFSSWSSPPKITRMLSILSVGFVWVDVGYTHVWVECRPNRFPHLWTLVGVGHLVRCPIALSSMLGPKYHKLGGTLQNFPLPLWDSKVTCLIGLGFESIPLA